MKIALDAMGGDFAPDAILQGAILFKNTYPDIDLILIGKESIIKEHLKNLGADEKHFIIEHASEVIEMGEHPTKAFSQKQDSSIAKGFSLLAKGQADAFASAGNTGAMMVGSMFTIKPIQGVIRPAIAGFIPKETEKYGVLLDVGANAECKAEVLEQFAVLGSVYADHVLGYEKPKVGLMNLGEEEQKGPPNLQSAHQLLKANSKINFIGNVEGRDVFNDKADVIVCDGFTGNVILKMAETFYELTDHRGLKHPFLDLFNYARIGGSPILGVNGNVMIGHGVSSPIAIKNLLYQVVQMVEADITSKMKKAFISQS